jgi:hypothetical protein
MNVSKKILLEATEQLNKLKEQRDIMYKELTETKRILNNIKDLSANVVVKARIEERVRSLEEVIKKFKK